MIFLKDDINIIMLNEFEKQIDDIIARANENNFNEIINLINNQKNYWQLCRFDLKNYGDEFNRINILENPNNLYISFPHWLRDNFGQGCQIEGHDNKLNFKFQCMNDGKLKIYLRGIDYRNLQNIRCPVYIIFTIFKLDDSLIFNEDKLIHHDQSYEFEVSSTDKEVFDIYLEFKTIFDYYPFLLNFFNDINSFNELNEEYDLFKKQVKVVYFLERFYELNSSSLEMYDFMNKHNGLVLEENLFSHDSFLSYYYTYLSFLELNNHINQLNKKIEFLENKVKEYEHIIYK